MEKFVFIQDMEPGCSIPLPQAGFIKDFVWRRAAKYGFLVLSKDGKLFHAKFPDTSLTELMDGVDAGTKFTFPLKVFGNFLCFTKSNHIYFDYFQWNRAP